jgi:hypothetical protein
MKRALIACVAVVAIAVPTSATAASTDFTGTVVPAGNITFTYKKTGTHRKVVNLMFDSVPIDCNDGEHTTAGNTTGFAFKVNHQKFGDKLVNSAGTGFLEITGKFSNQYHEASGTIRVHGNHVATDDGPHNGCNTGTDDWNALG